MLQLVASLVLHTQPDLVLSPGQLLGAPTDIDALIEKRLRSLFRDSIVAMLEERKVALGFGGIFCSTYAQRITLYVEINARRNIWIHNDGRVDAGYLRAAPGSSARLGLRLAIDLPYLREALYTLRGISAVAATAVCTSVFKDPIRGGVIGRHARTFKA
jgi:hypothetical protein